VNGFLQANPAEVSRGPIPGYCGHCVGSTVHTVGMRFSESGYYGEKCMDTQKRMHRERPYPDDYEPPPKQREWSIAGCELRVPIIPSPELGYALQTT